MNNFVGLYGVDRPAETFQNSFKTAPQWHDAHIALGGAPVWRDSRREIIVCGEVVLDNLSELRHQLERPTAEPGTLIAELYRQHGAEVGGYLLGMLAIAIWDTRSRQLTLLRDGVGARTLYYAQTGAGCWFAARSARLRQTPAVSSDISLAALREYLIYAYVPGAQTMWRNICELRPGEMLTLPDGQRHSYWQPQEQSPHDESESLVELAETDLNLHNSPYAHQLRGLLETAVKQRLPQQAPVGVFLSGGLDSSCVTALAARHAPSTVHTYAIHFGKQYPNELPFAQMVADHCQTEHHVLDVSAARIRRHLLETMTALDDPIGDPLTVPNLLLGRAAAQDVTHILNGEGGDPCFGGPKNQPLLLNELYGSPTSRAEDYLRSYRKCYADLPSLLKPEVQAELASLDPPEARLRPILEQESMRHFLNKLMLINVQFKGADHILTKVNNLTTANGLLGRSPLFDRRIVEFSFAVPPQHKLAAADEKAVLKTAVRDLLPNAIIDRPKSGMRVPVQRWFRWELWLYARWRLLAPNARIYRYVNRAVVWNWLRYEGEVWPRYGAKLWLLLTLEIWLQGHNAG